MRVNSASSQPAEFNPYNLIADPGSGAFQPLAFSALNPLWLEGLAFSEILLIAILGFAIASLEWQSMIVALSKIGSTSNSDLQKLIDQAGQLLSEKHDELEKPARDLGILDDAKQIREGGYEGARNYEKPGGSIARDEDFAKFPGEEIDRPDEGIKIKILPDGKKVISRAETRDGIVPTIEIQTPGCGSGPKIKIRYT